MGKCMLELPGSKGVGVELGWVVVVLWLLLI